MLVKQIRFWLLLVLGFVMLHLLVGVYKALPSKAKLGEVASLRHKNSALMKENNELAYKIKQVQSNGNIIQQYLRYHKGYVAPGEIFYQVDAWS